MSYKHKSGAQKRKEKDERELKDKESKKGQLSLGHFFKSPLPSILTESEASVEVESNINRLELDLPINTTTEIQPDGAAVGLQYNIDKTSINADNGVSVSNSTPSTSASAASQPESDPSWPCRYFDIGDPSFDPSRDLKYPHIPMPEQFPEDCSGFSVPTLVLKKKLPMVNWSLEIGLFGAKLRWLFTVCLAKYSARCRSLNILLLHNVKGSRQKNVGKNSLIKYLSMKEAQVIKAVIFSGSLRLQN